MSDLRLLLVGESGKQNAGLHGEGKLNDGTMGAYRGPFYRNDTIKYQVQLSEKSDKNEVFNMRVFLDEIKEPIVEEKGLKIPAGSLTSKQLSFKLDSDKLGELTKEGKIRIAFVSESGCNCAIDENYHNLLLSDSERELQTVAVHQDPIALFHPERAVHFGPEKTVEEERNKKYDPKDADSYHYTLIASKQQLVICLTEPLRQQQVKFELHNKKQNAMKPDSVEFEIPAGSTEFVTPCISFETANRFLKDKTKQIEIIPVSGCRIASENEQGKKGKNQSCLLRIKMLKCDSGSFYFGKDWVTPSHSAKSEYAEEGEMIPLVSPYDQVWMKMTRDDSELLESKNDYYLMCEVFGDKAIPVEFNKDAKESGYIHIPGSKAEKGLPVLKVKEDEYKLRFYRKRTYRKSVKLKPSEKKVDIGGEPFILTKIYDTQMISLSRRMACFTDETIQALESVKPGQENVAIKIRLTVPAGPMTWLKLIPGPGSTTFDEYFVPIGSGESLVEQVVSFQKFSDHSVVSFSLEIHNGAVETLSSSDLSDQDKEIKKGTWPDKIGGKQTTISFNAERPIEESLYQSSKTFVDQKDIYDDSKIVGLVKGESVLSLRFCLNYALGEGAVRQFTIASEAFSVVDVETEYDFDSEFTGQKLGYDKEKNKDGNHLYDAEVIKDTKKCKEHPVMVSYQTLEGRGQYTVTVCSPTIGEGDEETSLVEFEVNVRVSHPAQPAVLAQSSDELDENESREEVDEWEARDKNEKNNVFLIKILQGDANDSDLTCGNVTGIAVELGKILSVSVGRDLDQHSDDTPWIEPSQRYFASGDRARVWLTCSEKPNGSNATCYLVSPIIKTDEDACQIPVEFSTTEREKSVDITFDIDGIGETKYKDWMVKAGRWLRNVWEDHKTSTLFLEEDLAAAGDDTGQFKGARNPTILTGISLNNKRYVGFRKNNQFASSGPFRIWDGKQKPPLDAPALYIHLSIPAPLDGCTFKITAGKKATFFCKKDDAQIFEALDRVSGPEHDCVSLEDDSDKSVIVHIAKGNCLGVVRVAFQEDSLASGGTIKIEEVDDGFCHLHSKSNRNITLDAFFGEPKIKAAEIDIGHIPQYGG
ncbi:MAG: hypothetical protein HRU15_02270, partial [Planctomycetes bacterium]|nr:hypothetical protein [Planctomycetota bacterium]